jgi:hypothetical protein
LVIHGRELVGSTNVRGGSPGISSVRHKPAALRWLGWLDGHPDAAILTRFPGLGTVPGARILGEFGDHRARLADVKALKAFAGTAADGDDAMRPG